MEAGNLNPYITREHL